MDIFAQQVWGWDKVIGPLAGSIVTGTVALTIWWLNRKRPNKILAQELDITSLIRIASTVRPRIQATLDGKQVANLSQIEVAITNESLETIRDVAVEFSFPEPTKILECELSSQEASKVIEGDGGLKVSIPYLNSNRHHRDRVIAKVICDGEVRGCKIVGRGEGWSAVHRTLQSEMRSRLMWNLGSMILVAVLVGSYPFVLKKFIGIDPNEFSLRHFWHVCHCF